LKIFKLAEVAGGTESTVEIPALMSHQDVPEEMKEEMD